MTETTGLLPRYIEDHEIHWPVNGKISQDERVQGEMLLVSLARWLARKEFSHTLMKNGIRGIDPVSFANGTARHLDENRVRLREQAKALVASLP